MQFQNITLYLFYQLQLKNLENNLKTMRATHLHTSVFMSTTAQMAMGSGFR